jgi:hypothetical protein
MFSPHEGGELQPAGPCSLIWRRRHRTIDGSELASSTPPTLPNDPINAAFNPSGELFVANGHSNVFGGAGSIARFLLDQSGNWTPNGTITGNFLER